MMDIEKQVNELADWAEIPKDKFREYVRREILYNLKIMTKDYWDEYG